MSLITIPQAAAILGVSRVTAWRRAKEGSLYGVPVIESLGHPRVSEELVRELLSKKEAS